MLHSGVAAVAEGADSAILTVAGDEPEARAGLGRLERARRRCICQPSRRPRPIGTQEADGRRVLRLRGAQRAPIDPPALARLPRPTSCSSPRSPTSCPRRPSHRLRDAAADAADRPAHPGLAAQLGSASPSARCAWTRSRRHLGGLRGRGCGRRLERGLRTDTPTTRSPSRPRLRERIGPRPLLVLTLATGGYLLDDPGGRSRDRERPAQRRRRACRWSVPATRSARRWPSQLARGADADRPRSAATERGHRACSRAARA